MIKRFCIKMNEGVQADCCELAEKMGLGSVSLAAELLLRSMLDAYSLPNPIAPIGYLEDAVAKEATLRKGAAKTATSLYLDEGTAAAAAAMFAAVDLPLTTGIGMLLSSMAAWRGFPYDTMFLTEAMEAREIDAGRWFVRKEDVRPRPDEAGFGRQRCLVL